MVMAGTLMDRVVYDKVASGHPSDYTHLMGDKNNSFFGRKLADDVVEPFFKPLVEVAERFVQHQDFRR